VGFIPTLLHIRSCKVKKRQSKLDTPHIKKEAVKRLAAGESQSTVARRVGLDQSQVSRWLRKEDVAALVEKETLRLLEVVPDAIENVRYLVKGMKKAKTDKARELGYKASQDALKVGGIMKDEQGPVVTKIYQRNQFILSPVVQQIINQHVKDLLPSRELAPELYEQVESKIGEEDNTLIRIDPEGVEKKR
jgi:transcriptional regulator with XRE-family HTH domain